MVFFCLRFFFGKNEIFPFSRIDKKKIPIRNSIGGMAPVPVVQIPFEGFLQFKTHRTPTLSYSNLFTFYPFVCHKAIQFYILLRNKYKFIFITFLFVAIALSLRVCCRFFHPSFAFSTLCRSSPKLSLFV